MPTEVKICGLSDPESLDAALEAGADLVGLNFFSPSPRCVSIERAKALAARARGRAEIVAVTVDADDALLASIAEDVRPDLIQLHGRETPERLDAVSALTGLKAIKAIGVSERSDLARANDFANARRLLLDAKAPKHATRPGGNAAVFDWNVLDGFSPAQPWLLAGGLTPANVAAALAATGAPGVDVSSGVETAPGKKDPSLIHAFVDAVRAFDKAAKGAAADRLAS